MRALQASAGRSASRFEGVGGQAMAAEGVASLFPLADIAVMGFTAVARPPAGDRAAHLAARRDAVVAAKPDALVIIDSPDFTHAVARARAPARAGHPDRRLCQPERLGLAARAAREDARLCRSRPGAAALRARGAPAPWRPADTYVGHPLIERLDELRPAARRARVRWARDRSSSSSCPAAAAPRSRRLMEPFGAALGLLQERRRARSSVTIPAVAHLADEIDASRARPGRSRPASCRARRRNGRPSAGPHAALAASGTVTLELAPRPACRWSSPTRSRSSRSMLKYLIKVPSIVLTNLILGENVDPRADPVGLHAGEARRGAAAAPRAIRRSGDVRSTPSRGSTR